LTNNIILDTILSYMIYNNHIKGYLLKIKNIHLLIKRIVEEGTSHTYTLLHIETKRKQPITILNMLDYSITIESNACKHTNKVLFGNFLQNKKECSVCRSIQLSVFVDLPDAAKYSQHNIQAK